MERQFFQQPIQDLAVVEVDGEFRESERYEELVNNQRRLDIRHHAASTNRVEVTLHEFAVPSALSFLASPNRRDMVTLERRSQFVDVLCCKPRQRYRQVKTHANLTTALIRKLIQLAVGFIAALAGQNLDILQSWSVDGAETKRAIDLLGCIDQLLARHHGCR